MSFIGVTFAKQKVAPSDDALIRRAILPDGKLSGCAISYSGSTLTMASGHLMVCGRQIRHPSAQNWAVVDATSGFARLVLTIDLTRTASKEVFDQVTTAIEYASAEDGFVELEQSDINVSGTRYQVTLCVVSLGTGGITGIVTQLEKSAADGSGALNFSVVGGVTQPSAPKENTIWVNTPDKITSRVFSADQPEAPEEGMVWILTGTSSPVAFNALKKNGIMVYPIAAKQYVDGAWVEKTAKSWQDGAWRDWIIWYYKAGDECTAITGGWLLSSTGEKTEKGIRIGSLSAETKTSKSAYTSGHVDLTGIHAVSVHFSEVYLAGSSAELKLEFLDANGDVALTKIMAEGVTDAKDFSGTADVSALTGSYVLRIIITYSSTSGTAYKHYAIFDEVRTGA